jgi:hypothetical protein
MEGSFKKPQTNLLAVTARISETVSEQAPFGCPCSFASTICPLKSWDEALPQSIALFFGFRKRNAY